MMNRSCLRLAMALGIWIIGSVCGAKSEAQIMRFRSAITETLPKIVKIVGSGGSRGLEAYQSGVLISAEGHVLTTWSYVLDSGVITLTTGEGFKHEATLVGFDPKLDIAILKIDVADAPHFSIDNISTTEAGDRVLAFSNLYNVATGNEPVSIQQGFVSAVSNLSAIRGTWQSPYQGTAYFLDAMTNNPGATGGALTDRNGSLIGLIGKEMRDSRTGAWLNFGVPIGELKSSIRAIIDGQQQSSLSERDTNPRPSEPMSLELMGAWLVPEIVKRTPPYVDRVAAGSAAAKAGMVVDDLIIEVDGVMTPSSADVTQRLKGIDRDAAVPITVQRGNQFVELTVKLN